MTRFCRSLHSSTNAEIPDTLPACVRVATERVDHGCCRNRSSGCAVLWCGGQERAVLRRLTTPTSLALQGIHLHMHSAILRYRYRCKTHVFLGRPWCIKPSRHASHASGRALALWQWWWWWCAGKAIRAASAVDMSRFQQ